MHGSIEAILTKGFESFDGKDGEYVGRVVKSAPIGKIPEVSEAKVAHGPGFGFSSGCLYSARRESLEPSRGDCCVVGARILTVIPGRGSGE